VAATLAATGLPAAGLILELTENGLVGTGRGTTAMLQLRELRERGVRIAIDDFGTGYSSLAYLARLPVDIVKLDSSFANGLGDPGDGPTGTEFVRAVLAAIASVGLQSVAEGIETHDQAAAFRALRCEMAQGHHFFRAMPAADISAMLSAT
jgi:EAL domain-containing protein (putative c-di-GMP-specific phosphodiesterase class I)